MSRTPLISIFRSFAEECSGLEFSNFEELHDWSVSDRSAFWKAVWLFEGIESPDPTGTILASDKMPGSVWFPDNRVNYASQVLRHVERGDTSGHPAIIAEDEYGQVETVEWCELQRRVASFALSLRDLGVAKGDRVVAYLPNRPEAIVCLLACASLGAIWAVCAPDMGVPAILDRFSQIEPKVLIAADGVLYAGKELDRKGVVENLHDALTTTEHLIVIKSGYSKRPIAGALDYEEFLAKRDSETRGFAPEWVPFDHPLWIVYSSGTTGKPKALVHSHGGILLGAASARLHSDLGASYDERTPGERYHWFSSTGWMMWNAQVAGLLNGTTICIFDGSPIGARDNPDWSLLWRFAARNKVTFFGSGAQFYTSCDKEGVDFGKVGDLSALCALGSTASPLPAEVQKSVSNKLGGAGFKEVWWYNSSGGTDICGAFCSGNRELPEAPGKIQCRQLGAAVEAWDTNGNPLIGEVGELVCVKSMPNMPLYLWGDDDGTRYEESYFEHFPGVWRHGDWLRIEPDGTCEIFGRSDTTINRAGHRMGTSELYAAIERMQDVSDSLVVDVRTAGDDSRLVLFAVTPSARKAGDELKDQISATIRSSLSPRFVPDDIYFVDAIPRTLSTKKLELPIKRIFEGAELHDVVEPAAMANPECLTDYVILASKFRAQ